MPGRKHVAAPGEAMCGVHGCTRPAGFATQTPGSGPCRRHSGGYARTEPRPEPISPPLLPEPGVFDAVPTPEEALIAVKAARLANARRRDPNGVPSSDPLAIIGILLASGLRSGFTFGEAWTLATDIALDFMNDRRAHDWAEVLASTEQAWSDAYHGKKSPLAALDPDAALAHLPG